MSLTSVEVFDYTIGGTPASVLIESSSGPAIVDLDTNEPSVVLINQGPAGLDSITTNTDTSLIGYIYGNGTKIGGATAAASAGNANTLVLRSATGSAEFNAEDGGEAAVTGYSAGSGGAGLYGLDLVGDGYGAYGDGGLAGVYGNTADGIGVDGYSVNGTGSKGYSQNATGGESVSAGTTATYHHKFGDTGNNRSAVERVRGWFVWFFGSFTGRLKTADITANREWTLPNASGFVALTQNANGAVTNIEFYAKAAVPITAGQAVYISDAPGANKIITLAQANTEATSSKTIGLALQNLATNGFGYVVSEGDVTGLSINLGSGHGINEGDPIWLSPTTPGGLIFGLANKPSAPNHLVFLGYVTRINGNTLTEIFVKVQNGFELGELHNVAINGVANGQILAYESSTGLWKNKPTTTTKATTGNPASGIEGEICINTFDNNVKIYAEGGWRQIASW
jgi:hypothetical protein